MQSAVDKLVQLLLPGVAKSLEGVYGDAENIRRAVERCVTEVVELGRLSAEELESIAELLRIGEVLEPFLISFLDAVGACVLAELRKIEGC